MKKAFSLKTHFLFLTVLMAVALFLDFFTPGLDLTGFKFGRAATASLVIDYGRGGARQFTGEVARQTTVFDVLTASSQGSGLRVDYAHNGRGLTFLAIDGRSGPKVNINGRPIPLEELNRTLVGHGDRISIEWP